MKNISSSRVMLLLGAASLLTGCQAGRETWFGSAATIHEDTGLGLAELSEPIVPDSADSSMLSGVILAAAQTESDRHERALITLEPGDDVRRYLDGPHRRVILDFYADWCGPCRQQGRVLHDVEPAAMNANALIVKINVDQHRELAEALSVEALPTLMLYGDGTILQRRTGLTSASQLKTWIR